MKKFIIGIILAFVPMILFAQYDKMLEVMEDEMQTLEDGRLVLRFINAENGGPVDSATIEVDGGDTYVSDMLGKVYLDPPPDGHYAFRFSRVGFISATYDFKVEAGTIFNNRFMVSPILEFGALRVVLDWGKSPDDLDLHLVKEGKYHISYQDMRRSEDGEAQLDRDDRKGFGPETITVTTIDDKATYTCYVKNFSNARSSGSKSLSKSQARVLIYGNERLLKSYIVPVNRKGTTWMVFTVNGGKISDKNEVGNWY